MSTGIFARSLPMGVDVLVGDTSKFADDATIIIMDVKIKVSKLDAVLQPIRDVYADHGSTGVFIDSWASLMSATIMRRTLLELATQDETINPFNYVHRAMYQFHIVESPDGGQPIGRKWSLEQRNGKWELVLLLNWLGYAPMSRYVGSWDDWPSPERETPRDTMADLLQPAQDTIEIPPKN